MKKAFKTLLLILIILVPSVAFGFDMFCFSEAGAQYDIDAQLLKAISWTETKHNNEAINWNKNGTFDACHMQINSGWYQTLGHDKWMSIGDPCECTKVGAEILKKCIDQYGYKWEAVGCYNAVSRDKRIKYAWKVYNQLNRIYAAQDQNR